MSLARPVLSCAHQFQSRLPDLIKWHDSTSENGREVNWKMGNIADKWGGNFQLFLTCPTICMIIKEYFGVEICYVQSDMPYLHLCVLNELKKHLCDKVCLKITYKCVYYRVLHKIQFGESASPARNLIFSFRKRCSNTYSKWVVSSFAHKLGSKFRRFRASKN